MLDQKESLDKFNKTEILSSIFYDNKAMILKINCMNITKKHKHVEAK